MADEVAVMYAGRIVEQGPADAVLGRPSHPYTAALLRALPQPHQRRGELEPIPGQPPSPTSRPTGCPFRVRCHLAVDECASTEPALLPTATGVVAACHRSDAVPVDVREVG
jgi:oligopeptide/dipeptide ABC transporter ATP-binding protein